MSNYYYLGRSAFPDILIWVCLSVLIGGSGLVVMMVGVSASSAAQVEKEFLDDEIRQLDHDLNGGNMDSALAALERYRRDRGKRGAKENFYDDLLNKARLERRHGRKILEMMGDGKDNESVKNWLATQVKEGLNPRITREELLISVYEGLVNGTEKMEEFKPILMTDNLVPMKVREMVKDDGFDFMEGARARLNFFKGNNSNVRVQLDDLLRQEDEALLKTDEKYEERMTLLPELKKQYFEKSQKLDEQREKNRLAQGQAWDGFLEETKEIISERRKMEIVIYEKEEELKQKEGLLINKVEGQDWLPPLDLVDGKVLAADFRGELVTIDIGRVDALRVGQGFDVFRVKGDVLQEQKGRLKVVKLFPEYAVCQIEESDLLDPIGAGDVVANGDGDHPFDRKHSPSYVLSGKYIKGLSKDLVSHLIESSGGVIKMRLHKNIDFMVIGDIPNEEDIKTCRQLGVRTVRMRDIPAHLGYSIAQVEQIEKQNWN